MFRRKKEQYLSQKQRDYKYRLIRIVSKDYWSIKTTYKLSFATYKKLVKTGNFVYHQKSFDLQKTRAINQHGCQILFPKWSNHWSSHNYSKNMWNRISKIRREIQSLYRDIKEELIYNFKKPDQDHKNNCQPNAKIKKGLFWTEQLWMIHK